MIYIECPASLTEKNKTSKNKLFLAGGVSNCRDWQKEVVSQLFVFDLVVINPRRKIFDISNKPLTIEQIYWEFEMLATADIVSFFFCRETQCPITLYELGRSTTSNKKLFVGMDEDYSRRIDVEIQLSLARPEINIVYGLDKFIDTLTCAFKETK